MQSAPSAMVGVRVRLSLTTKIFLGFAALLGIFAGLAFFSVRQIRAVGEALEDIRDGHVALAQSASKLATHQKNRFRYLERALEETDPQARQRVIGIVIGYFPDVTQRTLADLRSAAERQINRTELRDQGQKKAFYQRIVEHADRLANLNRRIDTLTRTLIEIPGDPAREQDVLTQLDLLERSLNAQTYTLDVLVDGALDEAVKETKADQEAAVVRIGAMSGVAILIGLFLTFLAGRALAPIHPIVRYARAISRGDYEQSISVPGAGEFAALAEELRLMARSRKDREDELDRQADELERAYRRVEELKRYQESIVRSLRTAVIVTDRELCVTSTNPAAQTHWNLLAEEVRGHHLDSLSLGPALTERFGRLQVVMEQAQTIRAKAVPIGEILADVTLAPLENERGAVLGLVVTLEDVTEAVQTKEALIRSERLAAIGRMSAHVTHEIRNPLSSIGLNAEMLEDIARERAEGKEADEARSLCRAIVREVDRLSAITDEYLRFARLPRPELRTVDVSDLLRAIETFMRRDCEAAGVSITLDLPKSPLLVQMDGDQIRQALLNLLRNSKESMPEGGTVVLSAQPEDEWLVLSVADQGIGIDPEHLDRIFDPFYSTKLTGTGLGLALCQQIISEHGGRLDVTSEPGRGTEFRVSLKLDQMPRMTDVLEDSEASDATTRASSSLGQQL